MIDDLLRLYVGYHDPATLAWLQPRDYLTPVDLNALPLGEYQDNRLSEARFFLADITPDRPYVGLCSPRWPSKWPHVARPDQLDGLAGLLQPQAVYAPFLSHTDHYFWPEYSDRDHPGIWRLLVEMSELTGMWPTRRPTPWANTFICSAEVFLEFRAFFRGVVAHFHGRYGFDLGYDVGRHDPLRMTAYLYERPAMLYFANRTDLAVCQMPATAGLGGAGGRHAYLERHMGETSKAHARRLREGWYDRYIRLDRPGIDIGAGADPFNAVFRRYDRGDGDAQYMLDVPSASFWTVYASHILEHLPDPGVALANWYRLLAPGGHLVLSVPHRDLYERKPDLPSRWNDEHKTFWLPEHHDGPVTRGLRQMIRDSLPDAEILDLRVCDEGFHDPGWEHHAHGEFSIEAVVRKPEV